MKEAERKKGSRTIYFSYIYFVCWVVLLVGFCQREKKTDKHVWCRPFLDELYVSEGTQETEVFLVVEVNIYNTILLYLMKTKGGC